MIALLMAGMFLQYPSGVDKGDADRSDLVRRISASVLLPDASEVERALSDLLRDSRLHGFEYSTSPVKGGSGHIVKKVDIKSTKCFDSISRYVGYLYVTEHGILPRGLDWKVAEAIDGPFARLIRRVDQDAPTGCVSYFRVEFRRPETAWSGEDATMLPLPSAIPVTEAQLVELVSTRKTESEMHSAIAALARKGDEPVAHLSWVTLLRNDPYTPRGLLFQFSDSGSCADVRALAEKLGMVTSFNDPYPIFYSRASRASLQGSILRPECVGRIAVGLAAADTTKR